MRVQRFYELVAWQLADELRCEVFAFTETGPAARDFEYRDQVRGAIGSACRNTSEGFDRFRPKEFARFLEFARGSLGETQDCLIEASERQFISRELFDRLWTLSKRAIGANTNLLKYLQQCADTDDAPWRRKETKSGEQPGTNVPRTGNLRTREPENPRTKTENQRTENQRTGMIGAMLPQTPYTADLADRDPIAAMRDTPARVAVVARAWTPGDFERSLAPGKWSARQILIHLAQTELALGTRARMALTTPGYAAQAFDQDTWMSRESMLDGRTALDAFVAMAAMNAAFFASLTDADRAATLSHPEYGSLTVDWIIHQMAGHQIHHLKQLESL